MLLRNVYRLTSRRLRPSEVHRLERVAALVGTALALAEAYERGHVELNNHDSEEKSEKRRECNALSFAAFFDEYGEKSAQANAEADL